MCFNILSIRTLGCTEQKRNSTQLKQCERFAGTLDAEEQRWWDLRHTWGAGGQTPTLAVSPLPTCVRPSLCLRRRSLYF